MPLSEVGSPEEDPWISVKAVTPDQVKAQQLSEFFRNPQVGDKIKKCNDNLRIIEVEIKEVTATTIRYGVRKDSNIFSMEFDKACGRPFRTVLNDLDQHPESLEWEVVSLAERSSGQNVLGDFQLSGISNLDIL
ncbi:MAG: hypothetical protein WCW30_02390 [Candidatus Gracilibacteria bacterium]